MPSILKLNLFNKVLNNEDLIFKVTNPLLILKKENDISWLPIKVAYVKKFFATIDDNIQQLIKFYQKRKRFHQIFLINMIKKIYLVISKNHLKKR